MKNLMILIVAIACLGLSACSKGDEPSATELKNALIQRLPGWWEVKDFDIKAIQNLGNEVEPDYAVRFQATVRVVDDLFVGDGMENGVLFVRLNTPSGKQTEIFGKIRSRLYQGSWKHDVDMDGNPLGGFGDPLNQFPAGRVIVRGGDDEKKYLAEIQQKEIELRKNFESVFLNKILRQNDKWRAEIKIWNLKHNEICGEIDFRSLNCGGNLIYIGRKDNGFLFDEKLNYGNCVPGCQIWIDTNGTYYKELKNGEITDTGKLYK